MTRPILFARDGRIATLTINRPQRRNALDGAMYIALAEALREADADDGISVVLLTGSGGYFTAGNDLGEFIGYTKDREFIPLRFLDALVDLRKPLVAAVERGAVGVGTTMLLHCDVVYAGRSTRFHLPFLSFGLCPEGGSSVLLAQSAGAKRAARWLLLAEPFGAEQALSADLVTEVVDDDTSLTHARAAAERLAAMAPQALIRSKQLLKDDNPNLKAAMHREIDGFTDLLVTDHAQAALRGFVAARARK
jgi:enoyl-CoA hydratase/carnithine racemase